MSQPIDNVLYFSVFPQIVVSGTSFGRTEQVLTLVPDRNFASAFFPEEVDTYIQVFRNREGYLVGGHVAGYDSTFERRSMSSERPGSGYSPAQLNKEQVESLLKAAPQEFLATVYVDFLSNQPKTEQTRASFRQLLQDRFDLKLADAVERLWELPPILLQRPNDEYISLLVEARELFTMGYFYSCVAMCGIVGEKLIKDLLRGSTLVAIEGAANRPSQEAFDQFERVDVSAIVRFLNKAKLLSEDARQAAEGLVRLRNEYAHARGKNPQGDALEAIRKLHALLEGTVSVLKDYEIIDGKFVPRSARI
jgi:hypothetical protein